MSAKSPDQTETPTEPHKKHQGPYTEQELYVAVVRAWSGIPNRHTRRERPMRMFVFGWHFLHSVERLTVDLKNVVSAVVKIVSPRPSAENEGAIALPLRSEKQGPLDAVTAWWQPIEDSDGRGVHYVELSNATVVLLTVAAQDDQPDPGDSQ
jgi:hypothetical protein